MNNYYLLLISILFNSSCDFSKDQLLEPGYLKINSVDFLHNNNQPISHNIRDVWVFIDDYNYGTFTAPFTIPILETGQRKIKLLPGIRYYGILSKPEIYTLIQPIELSISINTGDTFIYKPSYKYKSNTIISIDEGFETGSIFINDLDKFPNTKLVRSNKYFKEGSMGVFSTLNKTDSIIETSTSFFKISNKSNSYLEFDFQSDIDISIGLISFPSGSKNYFLRLKPSSEWKKIYIPLFEVLASNTEENFQISVSAGIPDTRKEGFIAFDNIRVLSSQ